jgi:hypothetical protein
MQADQGDECLEQIRELLRDPVKKKAFVDAQRERWLWLDSSYKRAHARVDQMLEPEDRHFLDVRSQADVIRIVGHAGFLDSLLALEAKMLRQKRREGEKIETGRDRRVA